MQNPDLWPGQLHQMRGVILRGLYIGKASESSKNIKPPFLRLRHDHFTTKNDTSHWGNTAQTAMWDYAPLHTLHRVNFATPTFCPCALQSGL